MVTAARLTKADRRQQLLDIAADLLLQQGPAAVTMERLAQQAGVSKALPYVHFDNAEAVLVELYRQEVEHLEDRITSAMESQDDRAERVRCAVRAYFGVVKDRGAIFATLGAPGSTIPRQAEAGSRRGTPFVVSLLERELGLPHDRAKVVAAVVTGALGGAVDAWVRKEISRQDAEEAVSAVALRLVLGSS
jgi:AcrR family transcriptional regulator